MTVNFNSVIRMMGVLLIVLGGGMVPAAVTAGIYGEALPLRVFTGIIILCFFTGFILIEIFRPSLMKLKARDGFLIVTLCWLVASLIGAAPFTLTGAIPSYIDAFFETCSGFSTTGSSILTDIESLPKSVLFWRSFTHWMGGMGIIVLATAFLPQIGVEGQLIASAETPGPTLDKLTPKYSDTARNLYLVYLLFTAIETALLMFGGMSLYDSLVHTFGTVGTGGFSCYADSVGHFSSPYLQWVITIFMAMCGINFNLYFVLGRKGFKAFFRDSELRLYLIIIGAVTFLIFLNLVSYHVYDTAEESFRTAAFQVSSIITTTGFATTDFDLWPTFSKMMIFLVMLTGACSSSTGGGIKIIRVLVSLKLIRRSVALRLHPNRVITVNVNNKEVPQEVSTNIANFVFFYIFLILAGTLVISFNGFDLVTTLTSVITCLGNIGPGFNLVGPTMNFSIYSNFSKLILSFLMIAGRLELFTFFMLFSPHYWNANKA